MIAQQVMPATTANKVVASSCVRVNSAPRNISSAVCETLGSSEEVMKTAKQEGLETSFSKNKDGRIITYFRKNPRTGQRVIVRKRLIIRN
jgi:hypothetical protein